jgi:hypothetical protein
MLKKFGKWLWSIYIKHHDCKKHLKPFSETLINGKVVEEDYKCIMCEKHHFNKFYWQDFNGKLRLGMKKH